MVMPRTDLMPGFNRTELNEVHSPSRYFALLSFCSGRSIVLWSFDFFLLLRVSDSFLRNADDLSEARPELLATEEAPRICHKEPLWKESQDTSMDT